MKIGFFSETYSPDINGVITSMNIFKEEFERAGHKVYVFAPGRDLFSFPRPIRRERKVYRFNSFSYPAYKSLRVAIPFNWPIQRHIPKLGLDLVHSHTPFSMGLFAAGVSRQLKIPHVHTYHTLYPEYVKFYFPGFKQWNQKAAEKLSALFCNRVTEVIAPSDGIKKKLKEYGIIKPITTVPTGIDRGFFEAADRKGEIRRKFGIPAGDPVLITVARLGKEKSIDFLLRSFQQVLRYRPDAWYLIVGDGPARLELETAARELGVIDRVIFTGFLKSREEVMKAYATANAFIFASKTDTQCLTLLEAAAAGLPLVARYDKPLETALTHNVNGFFIRESEAKFAWKVHKLLADQAMAKRFCRESIKTARGQSAAKRARELLTVYERAIATRRTEEAEREQNPVRQLAKRLPRV